MDLRDAARRDGLLVKLAEQRVHRPAKGRGHGLARVEAGV